jgi:HAD superfamily hydrolase (TIGR01549 family)
VIKAVFFDWYNTLARYEPPREELHYQALQELGFNTSPQKILNGLLIADRDLYQENIIRPMRKRPPEEQAQIYLHYQHTVLSQAGFSISEPEVLMRIMGRVRELFQRLHFVLFDDVLPTLRTLKERRLTLGLLTNLDRDITPVCRELGLEPYIDLIVTSGEVGEDKPNPPIFLTALERAGVKASEAIHVGDQYQIDIVGARGVGIAPLLLDRYDVNTDITDCPRIHSLTELSNYLS